MKTALCWGGMKLDAFPALQGENYYSRPPGVDTLPRCDEVFDCEDPVDDEVATLYEVLQIRGKLRLS